eukprot:scaffold14768_cov48-Phaeocystis_antarctica.AAC.2
MGAGARIGAKAKDPRDGLSSRTRVRVWTWIRFRVRNSGWRARVRSLRCGLGFGWGSNRSSVSSWIMLSAAPGDTFYIAQYASYERSL